MAHIGCTAPLAATPVRVRRVRARGLGFGPARGEPGNGTTLTSDAGVGRFCRVSPARFISAGMERDISQAASRAGGILKLQVRGAHTHSDQQRCITPCSSCASWDSSPSPPPATSRTAPGEGREPCRRLGADRFGTSSLHPGGGRGGLDSRCCLLLLSQVSQLPVMV